MSCRTCLITKASLQRDLDRLSAKLTEMAGRTEQSLRDVLTALMTSDRQLAYSVILRDTFIDANGPRDRPVMPGIHHFASNRSGLHLRFAAAAIKINLELERIGDYAKSIAKHTLKLSRLVVPVTPDSFRGLAERAIPLVRKAVESFGKQDVGLARALVAEAEDIDTLRSRYQQRAVRVAESIAASTGGLRSIDQYLPLASSAWRTRRVTSHKRRSSP
jgi:phosphate transport system protein